MLEDRTVRAVGPELRRLGGRRQLRRASEPGPRPRPLQVKEVAADEIVGARAAHQRHRGRVGQQRQQAARRRQHGRHPARRRSTSSRPTARRSTGIASVEAGESTSYAVTTDGRVRNWGVVHCDGTASADLVTRTNVADLNPLFGTGNVQIASGDGGGALARKADGSVWSCNSYTQLNARPGTNNAAVTPAKIPTLSGIVDVAMGSSPRGGAGRQRRGLDLGQEPQQRPRRARPGLGRGAADPGQGSASRGSAGGRRRGRLLGHHLRHPGRRHVLVWGDNNNGSAGVGNTDYNVVGTPQVALGGGRAIALAGSVWNGLAIVRPADDPAVRAARRSTCRRRWRTRR